MTDTAMEDVGVGPLIVGNDVVDLTAARTRGKAADRRFLDRILDHVERAYVDEAGGGDLALWSLWAAKEAAYKIASKLRPEPPVFDHSTFGVRWSSDGTADDPSPSVLTGTVLWQELEVMVLVTREEGFVHAVGHAFGEDLRDDGAHAMGTIGVGMGRLDDDLAEWTGSEADLMKRLTPREADAVHSRASAAVRIGARSSLAEALAVEASRLEIICAPGQRGRRPPWVFVDGDRAPADVSLSHDGPWLAWAWSVERGASAQNQSGR